MNIAGIFSKIGETRGRALDKTYADIQKKYHFSDSKTLHAHSEEIAPHFRACEVVVDDLSIPIEVNYHLKGGPRPEYTTIYEVRAHDSNYLLRGFSLLNNRNFYYSSTRMENIKLGPNGLAIDSLENMLGRHQIFQKGGYKTLRYKLHLLLYLARRDGQFGTTEQAIIHQFLKTQAVPEQHLASLEAYFINSFITADIFQHSLKMLKDTPRSEMEGIVRAAEEILRSDVDVSREEQQAFNAIYHALKAA